MKLWKCVTHKVELSSTSLKIIASLVIAYKKNLGTSVVIGKIFSLVSRSRMSPLYSHWKKEILAQWLKEPIWIIIPKEKVKLRKKNPPLLMQKKKGKIDIN